MSRHYLFVFFVLSSLVISLPRSEAAGGHFKKIMIVVLENEDFQDAIRQPFLAALAQQGATLNNYYAVTHPSQPNYIALVSGSTHGVTNDSKVVINAKHLGDLLEARGLRWKIYAEQFPGKCFSGNSSGDYARKHVPFISFKNVQDDPMRCAQIVNADALAKDIETGSLADFSLYVPDLKNDGHDTGIEYADRWLSKTFGPILKNSYFTKDMLFVVTFDEGSLFGGNRVLTLISGNGVSPGTTSNARYNHYSLLRTIEDEFGLGTLKQEDARAVPVSGIWK